MMSAEKVVQNFKEMIKTARNFAKENPRKCFTMTAAQMQAIENRVEKFKSLCAGKKARMMSGKEIDAAELKISALSLKRKLGV